MSSLGETLIVIRKELGFKTSKSIYLFYADQGLDCNYQYYVKIEKNLVVPSANIINQMAKILKVPQAEKLVKSFCTDQFKSFSYLFKADLQTENTSVKKLQQKSIELQGQKKLTERQVHVLARSRDHYHLFLLMTLAREPLSQNQLNQVYHFKKAIEDLSLEKILILQDENLISASTEFAFPKAESESLKKCYAKFDEWDKDFTEKFNLESVFKKMLIRRISPRYLHLIRQQIEVLIETTKLSDENDMRFNNQVIQLQIKLSNGSLPG